jgi:hypothetical protein
VQRIITLNRLVANACMLISLAIGIGAIAGTAEAANRSPSPPAPGKYPRPAKVKRYQRPTANNGTRDSDEDRTGTDAGNTYSSDFMLYRGGPVQTSPNLYVVFWGDWSWTGDPYDVEHRLLGFLKGVGGSGFNAIQTQYAQGCDVGRFTCQSTAVHIMNPPNQFKGAMYDSSFVPTTPTAGQVANEALKAARYFGDYTINAQYIVALPRGHGDDGFVAKGGRSCAWHYWVNAPTAAVQYTNLPYMPDAGQNCGNYSVNNSILDGVTIIESHEYAETETDPWVGAGDGYEGWNDSARNFGENGDKCNGAVANRNVALATGTFPVQAEWSNYTRYWYGFGCLFSG